MRAPRHSALWCRSPFPLAISEAGSAGDGGGVGRGLGRYAGPPRFAP